MTAWSMTPGDWRYVTMAGLRLQVTPEGDCREASFVAHGQGVGLMPLQAVQISVDGTPLFYGEVRVGGNARDVDGHQFTLRSLALRLKEVEIPAGWSTPQQSAEITVRSLLEAVLPQLDHTITLGEINLPFDCRAIVNANNQNPYALLEQIAADGAGMNAEVRFGVNASKQFFFVPRNTGGMNLGGNLTSNTKWTGPVAETPCTAVRWFVAKKPDGQWLTYLSQSPLVSAYGLRVKPVSLVSSVGVWEVADMTLSASADAQVDVQVTDSFGTPSHDLADAPPRLIDPDPRHRLYSSPAHIYVEGDSPATELAVSVATNATRISLMVAAGFSYLEPGAIHGQLNPAQVMVKVNGADLANLDSPGVLTHYGDITTLQLSVNLANRPETSWTSNLWLAHLRPERLNTGLLDRLANFHYSVPAETAGEVEATGLTLERGGNSQWGPVAAIEYRITAGDGVCTALMIGQPDDPAKLAQAELIKARDQKSVIAAITSST